MIIHILLTLQTMPTNSHAVVGGVKDVCVIQFTHYLELLEHPTDLNVDIFTTGKLPADLISDCALITPLPNALDPHLIPDGGMTVVEGMFGEIIDRERRLFGVGGWDGIPVSMIDGPVLGQ